MEAPSKSQVKRAGSFLRKLMRGEIPESDDLLDRLSDAVKIIDAFRAAHQTPLTKANMGLRSMIKTEECEARVSQRLKRFGTIIDKLEREPTLSLDRMQDIGGCRAVLQSIEELRRVEARIKKRRPPVGYSDYIATPRSSGYRGVHLIVQYDDRCIEIQLRTQVMHEWAITIERLTNVVGGNMKGDGTHPVQLLMSTISEAMAIEESGGIVPSTMHEEITRRRVDAMPYLEGN